jgi:hypothetical protein
VGLLEAITLAHPMQETHCVPARQPVRVQLHGLTT